MAAQYSLTNSVSVSLWEFDTVTRIKPSVAVRFELCYFVVTPDL